MTALRPPLLRPPPPGMLVTPPTTRERLTGAVRATVPSRDDLVDAVAVVLLLGLVLVGLTTSYDGWVWMPVGLVGVLLGLVVTHLLLAARMPALVVLVTLAVVYVFLGGPLATRQDLLLGVVPSGSTVVGLAATSVGGWGRLLTSVLPVDSAGPLMALPFLLGLVGASVAYATARRWTSVAPALVPPITLLLVTLLLGTGSAAEPTWRGALFAVVLLAWAAVRAGRHGAPLLTGEGVIVRTVTAVVLLGLALTGGLLLGPRLPGSDTAPRAVWRSGTVPATEPVDRPSPLAGFRASRSGSGPVGASTTSGVQRGPATPLFTISGLPTGTPVRLLTMSGYDGSVWTTDGQAFRAIGHHVTPDVRDPSATPITLTVAVPADGYTGPWLPTAGAVTGLTFLGPRADQGQSEVRLDIGTSSGLLPRGLAPGDGYRLEALVSAVPTPLPVDVALSSGSTVDTSAATFLDARLAQWSAGAATPWAVLRAAAAAMRTTGAYTDGGPVGSPESAYLPGHGLSRLSRFFSSDQMVGDDEQYAAALALVGNRLDVPTRVVLGAMPEGDVVAGQDVHAWVEVRTAAGPWLPILPQEFIPAQDRQPAPQQQRSEPLSAPTGPATSTPPGVTTPPVTPARTAPAVPGARGGGTSVTDLVLVVLGVALTLVLLAAVGLVGRAVVRAVRRRRRLTTGSPAARVAAGWSEVVGTASGLGLTIPRGLTRLEQARVLQHLTEPLGAERAVQGAEARKGGGGDLVALAARADALLFAADPPGEAESASFGAATTDVRSRLRRQASFWGRLSAALDLPGLIHRVGGHWVGGHGFGGHRFGGHRFGGHRSRSERSPAARPPHDGPTTRGGPPA